MPQRFDDLTDIYEAMIDWPRRLANEEPFYRQLTARLGAKRVLDAACGTGRHAAMIHSWGLSVEGADIAPAMIDRARAAFGESDSLRWAVRSFTDPVPDAPFDVVLCVGNSLALVPDRAAVASAFRQMLAALRPHGAAVFQVLNAWALPDGPCLWQKNLRAKLAQGEVLILKGVHRSGDRAYVELVVSPLDPASPGAPKLRAESVPFLALKPDELTAVLREAGARQVAVFGNYKGQPYDPHKSPDLLVVAET